MSAGVITKAETDLYEEVWGFEGYADRSPGERSAPIFDSLVRERGDDPRDLSVLDAGCGSGKGALVLAALGCRVTMCDLTSDGLVLDARKIPFFQATLWHPLTARYTVGGRYDYVYCVDVLEHLPTMFVALAVIRLLEVARRGLFLRVSCSAEPMGTWMVGRPLHLTLESFSWWRDMLRELGDVVEARDVIVGGVFLVVPR
jgi:SAM-dependent methyltransferase